MEQRKISNVLTLIFLICCGFAFLLSLYTLFQPESGSGITPDKTNVEIDADSIVIEADTSANMSVQETNYVICSDTVCATFYNAIGSQTDDSPDRTATGFQINVDDPYSHRIIAISRDLENKGYAMGDSVRLTFETDSKASIYNGVYVIQDRMHQKWTKKVDLLVAPDMYMGKFYNVLIEKIN